MAFVPKMSGLAELPDPSDFSPSLIPEPARPLVLAPILLVKNFARVVIYVVLVVLGILGVILATIPAQISTFGVAAQLSLTLMCAALTVALIYMAYAQGKEQVDMLELLEDFCAGEVSAALHVARIIAMNSAGATTSTARALAVSVTHLNARDALASGSEAAAGAAGAAASATEDAAKAVGGAAQHGATAAAAFAGSVVGGTLGAVKDPRAAAVSAAGAVGGAADIAVQAGNFVVTRTVDGVGHGIKAAMELNPLAAFQKIIEMVLEACWYLVVLTPPVLVAAGWTVWKLGIQLSGLELIACGFGFAIFGGAGWWVVKETSQKQLANAGVQIVRMQVESAGAAVGLGEGLERGKRPPPREGSSVPLNSQICEVQPDSERVNAPLLS